MATIDEELRSLNEHIKALSLYNPLEYISTFMKNYYRENIPHEYNVDLKQNKRITRFLLPCSEGLFSSIIVGINRNKRNYKILSVMPEHVKYVDGMLDDVKFGKNTSITLADDGTIFNLYFYNGRWQIGSRNGYSIGKYQCVGDITYKEIIDNVLSLYPDFQYNRLNKNKCYTLGFRHSDFHQFVENSDSQFINARAWFVQSVDIKKLNNGEIAITNKETIGLPYQSKVMFENKEQLLNSASTAMADYIANRNHINYGYIIGSVYVESSLMENIRKMFYEDISNDRTNIKRYRLFTHTLTTERRELYNVLTGTNLSVFKDIDGKLSTLIDAGAVVYNCIKNKVNKRTFNVFSFPSSLYNYINDNFSSYDGETNEELISSIKQQMLNPNNIEFLYSIIFQY